ncbi:XF1762 family protein [Serratia sp. H1n]|uniref:XF1762 family protein n=1 Tax=unclassified Serratia (in: enterobacteria) TaxID=2647522 RepID=UPI00350F89D1
MTPISFRAACDFVQQLHRHNKPPRGHKFSVGLRNDAGELVGVAMAGRPIARHFDDGLTLEVNRTCTDGTKNANSMLYGAVRGAGLERADAAVKQIIYAPISQHSTKPWEARQRLERLYGDVSRIELFSRCDVPGWDHWGNECPQSNIALTPETFSKTLSAPSQNVVTMNYTAP